jgi:hypothetical protein
MRVAGKSVTIFGVVLFVIGFVWLVLNAVGGYKPDYQALALAQLALWIGGLFAFYGSILWIIGAIKDQFEAYFILLVGTESAIAHYDAKGWSDRKIAQRFNELGIPNASGAGWNAYYDFGKKRNED